jgi:DNA primase
LSAKVVIPGEGLAASGGNAAFKDPADILKHRGSEALQKTIEYTIVDFEYLLRRGKALNDISTSEGKAGAAAFLFPYLETLDSEVSRDTCIGDIADALGIDRQAVLADYRRSGDGGRPVPSDAGASPWKGPIHLSDELFLLIVVVIHRELTARLRSTLAIEELEDPRAKELFIALEEWFRNDAPGIDDLLSRIQDQALRNFVIEQSASRAFSVNPETLFEDGIRRVKQRRLERRQAEIIIELRTQKRGESGRSLDDLLAEKVHIDAELRNFKEANP